MERTVVSGIVKKVEVIDVFLSFVTLIPIADEGYAETRVPVYMRLDQEFVGKPADIVSVREGFLGRKFKQTIETANRSHSTSMPYSLVKQINKGYRRNESIKSFVLTRKLVI